MQKKLYSGFMKYISTYILSTLTIFSIIALSYFFIEALKIGLIIFAVSFLFIILPEIIKTNKELNEQAKARKFYDDENNQ